MNTQEQITEILNKGVTEKRKGNYSQALNFYSKANDLDPTNIWTYYNPAKVQFLMGEFINSAQNYLKAGHVSIVNMLNRIDTGDPISMVWLLQIDRLAIEERRIFRATHSLAEFLLIDNNTPNHLGRTLTMMRPKQMTSVIQNDMREYTLGLQGKNSKPNMKIDESIFEPLGREYLLNNINWYQIEQRELNPNLIY